MRILLFFPIFLLIINFNFAQSSSVENDTEELVSVFISNSELAYLQTKVETLKEKQAIVLKAHRDKNNDIIGKNKGEIARIIHSAPTTLMNLVKSAKTVQHDPEAMGSRFENGYAGFKEMMQSRTDYQEMELLPVEVEILAAKAIKAEMIQKTLKESNYAIHESQENSMDNVLLLTELAAAIDETLEVYSVALNR